MPHISQNAVQVNSDESNVKSTRVLVLTITFHSIFEVRAISTHTMAWAMSTSDQNVAEVFSSLRRFIASTRVSPALPRLFDKDEDDEASIADDELI